MGSHPHFRAYAALGAVCFFWGTTYLGIRMALESFPPLLLIGIRFSISGLILLLYALLRGLHIPRGRELAMTSLFGVIVLGGGTGGLIFAEQLIPSGLAAVFVTTGAFWMVGIESLMPGGDRLHGPTIGAMLIGLCGVLMLVAGRGEGGSILDGNTLKGLMILQGGCAAWAFGSISQKRLSTKANPVIGGAVQQLATGLVFLLLAALIGPLQIQATPRGVGALCYLVTFGSLVGYSAYVYAMDNLPVAIVSIYNYVNPAVACFLGWLVYREPFGWKEAVAMVVIFIGVALVKRSAAKAPERGLAKAAAR